MLPASRGELAIRRMGALRRGPSLRAPDRAEEAWRSGDALSAPRAPSRSAACRPYRRDLHRGRTVQRRPRLARPRDGRSRPPPRRRRVAREASGTHSPPREGSSGVVGARVRVPSVGNNQRASSKRALTPSWGCACTRMRKTHRTPTTSCGFAWNSPGGTSSTPGSAAPCYPGVAPEASHMPAPRQGARLDDLSLQGKNPGRPTDR